MNELHLTMEEPTERAERAMERGFDVDGHCRQRLARDLADRLVEEDRFITRSEDPIRIRYSIDLIAMTKEELRLLLANAQAAVRNEIKASQQG